MDEHLASFTAAITLGDRHALESIVSDHVDVLARCFAQRAAHVDMDERGRLLEAVNVDDATIIRRLRWPPVSRTLLGRATRMPEVDHLVRSLAEVPDGPADPDGLRRRGEIAWLEPEAEQRGWTSHRGEAATLLDAPIELLDLAGPDVGYFVRRCTEAIIPVREPRAVFGSFSTDELIGCTVLVNPHRVEVAVIAEQLVHEAVHHCQGMFESGRPFIVDPTLTAAPDRYPSPWTGRPLTAKSLLAASAVWFAIAHHWERARPHVDAAVYHAGLNRAASGFRTAAIEQAVDRFRWALDPMVPELVATLRATVLRTWPD